MVLPHFLSWSFLFRPRDYVGDITYVCFKVVTSYMYHVTCAQSRVSRVPGSPTPQSRRARSNTPVTSRALHSSNPPPPFTTCTHATLHIFSQPTAAMADLNCYITTFNCGRKLIDVEYFAANLLNALQQDVPPELIVLSLQEIAPIGYSYLGGSLLAPYFARFAEAVYQATSHRFGKTTQYDTAVVRNVGMTSIMVFARRGSEKRIGWMQTAGVGVGLWQMGNKGAVGVRLGLAPGGGGRQENVISFVAAHLAPMESAWERRNEDWKSICEGLVFEKEPMAGTGRPARIGGGPESEPLLANNDREDRGSLFQPPSHIYFAGDLNYRTSDQPPKPHQHSDWPQPVESTSDSRHHSHWLEKDQLNRERKNGNTLHLLDEAPVDFPPTYKYSDAAQKHVASATDSTARRLADGRVNNTTYIKNIDEEVWLWAQHRTPSWCDRILYLASAPPTVFGYTALPVQPTSDHRPVALSFSIPSKPVNADLEPPFRIREDWRQRRATARRYEVLVGLAAYLGLTWEGEALLAGTIVGIIGGYLVLRALLGT